MPCKSKPVNLQILKYTPLFSNNLRAKILVLLLMVLFCCFNFLSLAQAASNNVPAKLASAPLSELEIQQLDKLFLGIPYRDDGALDSSSLDNNGLGRYTFFADQKTTLKQAGLNCSGFVLAASNKILKHNLSLDLAKTDRKQDSGAGSAFSEDWDFGLDLILNIVEGRGAKVLLPSGRSLDPASLDGRSKPDGRGFLLHDRAAWADVVARMQSGHLYLWAMSRSQENKPLQYHHVGLILVQANNTKMLYHAVRKGGVVKLDLGSKLGLERFLSAYKNQNGMQRYIYILGLPI